VGRRDKEGGEKIGRWEKKAKRENREQEGEEV